MIPEFFRRLWFLLNRRRFERSLTAEMEFHREMMERSGRAGFGALSACSSRPATPGGMGVVRPPPSGRFLDGFSGTLQIKNRRRASSDSVPN